MLSNEIRQVETDEIECQTVFMRFYGTIVQYIYIYIYILYIY